MLERRFYETNLLNYIFNFVGNAVKRETLNALGKSFSRKWLLNWTPWRGRWRWGRRRTWWRPWWRGRRRRGRRATAPPPPLPGWSGGRNKPQKLWPGLHTASKLLLLSQHWPPTCICTRAAPRATTHPHPPSGTTSSSVICFPSSSASDDLNELQDDASCADFCWGWHRHISRRGLTSQLYWADAESQLIWIISRLCCQK